MCIFKPNKGFSQTVVVRHLAGKFLQSKLLKKIMFLIMETFATFDKNH